MRYALNNNLERIEAKPNTEAICECCKNKVISKCGDINIWHWAHDNLKDCDPWYEPMTEWHFGWQNKCIEESREIVLGKHRADLFNGVCIIELQHSHISSLEIKERENFYKYLIWLLDFRHKIEHINFFKLCNQNYLKIKWFPKTMYSFTKPLFLDLGNKIIRVKKLNENYKGFWYEEVDFEKIYLKKILKK
jgi:competence protein CoiA